MRILILAFASLLFFSCKKSNDSGDIKLLRTESQNYNGNLLNTEFGYDNTNRITTITEYENNDQPVITVRISYQGNEVTLLSHPNTEPLQNRTKEVHLTLDASGKLLKRLEFNYGVANNTTIEPPENFTYDTLVCEYNADGLLFKTVEGRYDSIWASPTYNQITRLSAQTEYTAVAGNLTSSYEYAIYPRTTRNGGTTTIARGSSEYQIVFNYTKGFPNKTDFKNAAVLNEYQLYYFYYETPLSPNHTNMPDQVISNNVDKDINGQVTFTGNSTYDIDRMYNPDGLLSTVKILSHNTQFTQIDYFYGR